VIKETVAIRFYLGVMIKLFVMFILAKKIYDLGFTI